MKVSAYKKKKPSSLSDIGRGTLQPNFQKPKKRKKVTLLLKEKNLQIRIPARLSHRIEEEVKSFSDK